MASWLSNFWNSFVKKPIQALNNKVTGQALTPAEREANAFTASQAAEDRAFQANEAQKAREWEQQMSNTSYQRQLADMQAAGVNPALALGGSASGASTPSSPSPSGAMATSVSPDSGTSLGDILQLLSFKKQMQMYDAQINEHNAGAEQKRADASNLNAQTGLLGEEFKLKVRSADREDLKYLLSEKEYDLKRSLNDATIQKMGEEIKSLEAGIREKNQNIKESVARTANYMALEVLHRNEARQISALLPYTAALMSAQTDEARNNASYLGVQAAYQQKLIDSGYIYTLVDRASAEAMEHVARTQNIDADTLAKEMRNIKEQINTNIFSGHAFDYDLDRVKKGYMGDLFNYLASDFLAGCAQFLENFNPIAGIIGGE